MKLSKYIKILQDFESQGFDRIGKESEDGSIMEPNMIELDDHILLIERD